MTRKRGSAHTTLTETATTVVDVLERLTGVKMIAPGIIDARRSGPRHITAIYTTAGLEFIISGQGVQKVAVHLANPLDGPKMVNQLQQHKSLKHFTWLERHKKPGQ
jgi:hypothetical protein